MPKQPDNIFDDNGLVKRENGLDEIYRASRIRDEAEVIRLLDAHREQHGEPEQVAYANRAEHRQDDAELGRFPFSQSNAKAFNEPNDLHGGLSEKLFSAGSAQEVKQLLAKGADPNFQNDSGTLR